MGFNALFARVSPRLRRIARSHNGHGFFIDADDLYQEMSIYLWNNYKNGVPEGLNDVYIIKGCEFHILNYLRKAREKAKMLSLDALINENGSTLRQILPDKKEKLNERVEKTMVIDDIKNNGFTKREKEVFSLLLEGYTTREAGKKLGISHVMVVKFKRRIIEKCQKYRLPKVPILYFKN